MKVKVGDKVLFAKEPSCFIVRGSRFRYVGGDVIVLASLDLSTVVVTSISNHIKLIDLECSLCLFRHVCQLTPIIANIRDLMSNDEMMACVYCRLYVVANNTGPPALH